MLQSLTNADANMTTYSGRLTYNAMIRRSANGNNQSFLSTNEHDFALRFFKPMHY